MLIRHIVVLGHAPCGGVKGFVEDAEPLSLGDFIGIWMQLMAPAAEKLGPRGDLPAADYLIRLEQAHIANGLDNLMNVSAGVRTSAFLASFLAAAYSFKW